MVPPAIIEPVPADEVSRTLRFLVAGQRRDVSVALRAEAYERMMALADGPWRFWRARRVAGPVAASLVIPSSGGVGMVFHSPPRAPGVEAESVPPVVREASAESLRDGVSFVQSLVVPMRNDDTGLLAAAGFRRLAELVYMHLDLHSAAAGPASAVADQIVWRSYGQFGEPELADAITRTYEQSLDCPGLYGLRKLPEVIEGHKASGVFSPKSWWIAEVGGQAAGVALVNDSSSSPGDVELVYMGVARPWRGRGLGRTLVDRAIDWGRRGRREFLTVAVDSGNVHARRVYDAAGFRETDRRLAFIFSAASMESGRE